MSQTVNTTDYPMISMIFSAIAIFFLLFTDFGGFYYSGYYVNIWAYVNPFSSFESAILLLALIGTFGYHIKIMNKVKQEKRLPNSEELLLLKKINKIAIGIFVVGLLIFVINMFEADDWWFDAAFYASLIGIGINYYILSQMENDDTNVGNSKFCMACGTKVLNTKFCTQCGIQVV